MTDNLTWHRPSRCDELSCIEATHHNGHIYVRDSKNPHTPPLDFTPAEWADFLTGIRNGDFDDLI